MDIYLVARFHHIHEMQQLPISFADLKYAKYVLNKYADYKWITKIYIENYRNVYDKHLLFLEHFVLNIERNECAQTISLLQLRSCLSIVYIVDIERMRGDKYRDEIIGTTSARR